MNRIIPSAGAEFAIRRLQEHGFEAYAVGGCVRDCLLGRIPNDWDLTTNALPQETASCFSDHRVIETGMKHGTVAILHEGELLEITTYRLDGDYEDNRHPVSVTFSKDLQDDLSRRDFTVNAMAYHPIQGLVDCFSGQEDLKNGIIRCVGNPTERFEEDGLRILRAIRFASVLGFSLEEKTAEAVHSRKHLLKNIASERIREEFCKLLGGKRAVPILREFADVIAVFLPELSLSFGFDQKSKYHCYDVWEHTLHALEENTDGDLTVRLGILFHDVGKPDCFTEDEKGGHFPGHAERSVELTDAALKRLRFDNATRELILKLVKYHDVPLIPEEKHVKRALLRYGETGLSALLEIQRCDRLAHHPNYVDLPEYHSQIPKLVEKIIAENACLSLKSLAVKGDDLIALGYKPGKEIGEQLQTLLDAVIDGALPNDKDTLLDFVRLKSETK